MKKIISVSRRTDIPAFHGKWFLEQIENGRAFYKNPYNNKERSLSLKPEDVACFVFWSKNFIPFVDALNVLKGYGYNFYLNYTINNYPKIFEPAVFEAKVLLKNLEYLSSVYSPEIINWRYDPIIVSNITDFDFHIKNFNMLCQALSGVVSRCIISFVSLYKKTKKEFEITGKNNKFKIYEIEDAGKIELADVLSEIALKHGITLYSCSNDLLIQKKIKKASCIDANLIIKLFYRDKLIDFESKLKPTRKNCGCFDAVDIGRYGSCGHNCIYCYAK